MQLRTITDALERWAPRELQEPYDNCGLQVGDPSAEITSALVCLDCTPAVVDEAVAKGCQLIISHHPVIFKGLKSLAGNGYVQRTLRAALQHGVALYAIHTNLDNVVDGVNGEIAERLGLKALRVLDPKPDQLRKLSVFVPVAHAAALRKALFEAGAGKVGKYDECSFNTDGTGTFRAGAGTTPYVGKEGVQHSEPETRVEVIYSVPLEVRVLAAMRAAHPYEEVAYDMVPLLNSNQNIGSGMVGEWDQGLAETEFLALLKKTFKLTALRHTELSGKPIRRVALCGGSGAFLLWKAKAEGVDAYITGDVKYHDFFEADGKVLLVDIGHYGSEQFTMDLIQRRLGELFPTFAVRLTENVTDPIYHY